MADNDPIRQRVRDILKAQLGRDDFSDGDKLQELADFDSLEDVELVMALEDEFGIDISDNEARVVTVADVVALVKRKLP
jgi:acyl carrier protein